MKKVAKIITVLIILFLILVILDKFSTKSKTSLFLPQNSETRYFVGKVQSPSYDLKYIERKYKEKVIFLSKNPTIISSIKENGKKYYLNYGRWVKVTTYSDQYPLPYYVFENNDFLITFRNIEGEYHPFIDIKYGNKDSWYINGKSKVVLVSKNATVKTPSHIFYHCIETKTPVFKKMVEYDFYAPSQFLVKSVYKDTKTNTLISSYYLSKTN